MADYARRARDLGVNYIGSCCGAVATHVREMARALGKLPEDSRPWRLDYSRPMSAYEYYKHEADGEHDARHQGGVGPRPGAALVARSSRSDRPRRARALGPVAMPDGVRLAVNVFLPEGARRASASRPSSSTCPTGGRRKWRRCRSVLDRPRRAGLAATTRRSTRSSATATWACAWTSAAPAAAKARSPDREYSEHGTDRRHGGHRLDRAPALVRRQRRDVGRLLGRLQLAADGGAAAPRAQGDHRHARHRGPLPGRHPLHRRALPLRRVRAEHGRRNAVARGARLSRPTRRASPSGSTSRPGRSSTSATSATGRSGGARRSKDARTTRIRIPIFLIGGWLRRLPRQHARACCST